MLIVLSKHLIKTVKKLLKIKLNCLSIPLWRNLSSMLLLKSSCFSCQKRCWGELFLILEKEESIKRLRQCWNMSLMSYIDKVLIWDKDDFSLKMSSKFWKMIFNSSSAVRKKPLKDIKGGYHFVHSCKWCFFWCLTVLDLGENCVDTLFGSFMARFYIL